MASLNHDIDHPGNNNAFEVNAGTRLALKYNDVSTISLYASMHCFASLSVVNGLHVRAFNVLSLVPFASILSIHFFRFNFQPHSFPSFLQVSVLENHHAATLFNMLMDPKFNIFAQLPHKDRAHLRKRMTKGILGMYCVL